MGEIGESWDVRQQISDKASWDTSLKRSHIGAAGMRSELTFERGGTVDIARVKSGEANVFAEGRSPSALPSFIGKPVPMVPPCPFTDK